MPSNLDPGAQDPDFDYLVMQLRHIGAVFEEVEDVVEVPLDVENGLEQPLAERCRATGLTVPECSCPVCTRELITRYRPGGYQH